MSEDVDEMITDLWYLRDKPWESAFVKEQEKRIMDGLKLARLERETALLNNAAADEEEEEEIHHEG